MHAQFMNILLFYHYFHFAHITRLCACHVDRAWQAPLNEYVLKQQAERS